MREYTSSITAVGVDWLTCSASGEQNAKHLREIGADLLIEDAKRGNRVRQWKRGVYAGAGSKHVGIGDWKDRALVEVTGRLAEEWWRELVPLADRVSRIDLQVSVRQEPYDHMLALRTWAKSVVRSGAEGRPPDYDLYARRAGGATLYIGEGASRYKARLYERWYKEPTPENEHVWRYEVQARRERALQLAGLLPRGDEAPAWTTALVHGHFLKRGVVPIFASDAMVEVPPLPEPPTDRDTSLQWLARSVRPAIERHLGWGSYEQALRVLGVKTPDASDA